MGNQKHLEPKFGINSMTNYFQIRPKRTPVANGEWEWEKKKRKKGKREKLETNPFRKWQALIIKGNQPQRQSC